MKCDEAIEDLFHVMQKPPLAVDEDACVVAEIVRLELVPLGLGIIEVPLAEGV